MKQIQIFLVILIGFTASSFSQKLNADNEVLILGLVRSDPEVVLTEVELCDCLEDHEKLKQVLLATGIFYNVSIEKTDAITQITLAEKWTTIPIFKVNSGGGIQGYTFGVYDPNTLGRRIEVGAQYESLAGAPSFVVWNKVPRLFNSKIFSDVQIWRTQRSRLKYDQTVKEPVLIKALLQKSDRNYLALGYESSFDLRTRLFLENQMDRFTTEIIPKETLNQVGNQTIPSDSEVNSVGLQFDYGHTKNIRHSLVGTQHSMQIKLSDSKDSSINNFSSFKWETLHFSLFNDFLFGLRLQFGSTNTSLIQFWNYLGGFESIRGFSDNRFATRNFWLANFEGRYFLKESENYILQTTAFLDVVGIDEQQNKIENLHAASIGIGSRIILPKFYRVTIRFDYAKPLIKSDNQNISFGVQQFF